MPITMRKRNTGFIVQSLDHATVIFSFRTEVVEQKFLMSAQHFGDLLHWLEARAHSAGGPCLQICRGPGRASVEPEAPEAFLELPGTRCGSERSENRVELGPGLAANLGGAFQQQKSTALGAGPLLLGAQPTLLATAHLINRLIEVLGDVEWIVRGKDYFPTY